MNEALIHQQAALEEILSMMRELIHYQDPRLKSAQEHLDEVKRIMESNNECR